MIFLPGVIGLSSQSHSETAKQAGCPGLPEDVSRGTQWLQELFSAKKKGEISKHGAVVTRISKNEA